MLINWSMGETCQLFEVEWSDYCTNYSLPQREKLDASGIIANISVGGINDSVKDILLCSGLCHIIGRNTALSLVQPRNQNKLDVHIFSCIGIFSDILGSSSSKKMGKLLVLCRYSGISNFDCRLCRIPDLSVGYLD